jgi:hypothetical protein
MAAADYRPCDRCGKKTFYDAELDYVFDPQADRPLPRGLGGWAAICPECAETHRCVVVPIQTDKEER